MHRYHQKPKALRIAVCNRSPILREGIRAALEGQGSFEIVAETGTARSAIQNVRKLRPDAILLDIATPDLHPAEATQRIKEIDPEIQVLLLTMWEEGRRIAECLRAGASEYIPRRAAASEVRRIIHAACRRGGHGSAQAA